MEYITLGKTESSVSNISLGTWAYGGSSTSGNQSVGWADQADTDSKKALLKAHEVGINHWDTADVYGDGRSEGIIGGIWDDISRHEIFLATKVGWDMGTYSHWYHPKKMIQNMERSLKNLKTDCVDLMYLHHCNFGKNGEYFDDAMDVLLKFKQDGKTKFIGLSDWSDEKIITFIDNEENIVNLWEHSNGTASVGYLTKDSILYLPGKISGNPGGGTDGPQSGLFKKIDWNNNIIWEWQMPEEICEAHHEL